MSEALVEVRDLTKRYPLAEHGKFVQACKGVTFSVAEGETLGLVGESGSGKTTVGRCLARLVEPTEGEILFRGQRIDTLHHRELRPYRAKLQIVFQEPSESLNPRMNVAQLLKEPLKLHGTLSKTAREGRVRELLDQVGLPARVAGIRPGGLSAGNQQRVAIARALATNPEFLVLDEPTSSLPADAEETVLALLTSLQKDLGLSYLFISHDLSLVRHFCDRVAVMYLSQVVETGSLRDVFDDPQMPYSRALLSSVLLPDPTRRRRDREAPYQLRGEIPSPVDLPPGCYLAGRCPIVVERCRHEPQQLEPLEEGHLIRCWRVTEGDYHFPPFPTRYR